MTRKAQLGLQGIEREAARLKTMLNIGLDIETDNLAAVDWTTTTTASWVSTPLSIALTPTQHVYGLALLRAGVRHSVANADVQFRINGFSTPPIALWDDLTPGASDWIPFVLWGIQALTAGTAYTFTVQAYMTTAGTLTVEGAVAQTKFVMALLSKATLA